MARRGRKESRKASILRRKARVSCHGYVGIQLRAQGESILSSVNQGGTAAENNEFRSSLMELKMSSVKDDFFVFYEVERKERKEHLQR